MSTHATKSFGFSVYFSKSFLRRSISRAGIKVCPCAVLHTWLILVFTLLCQPPVRLSGSMSASWSVSASSCSQGLAAGSRNRSVGNNLTCTTLHLEGHSQIGEQQKRLMVSSPNINVNVTQKYRLRSEKQILNKLNRPFKRNNGRRISVVH